MELELETYIDGLDYNRKKPEGVKFVKNKVIEEPEFGLLFIDVFRDEAFHRERQRVSDVQKVKTATVLGYKMVAFYDKTLANLKFVTLMDNMISERPDKCIKETLTQGCLSTYSLYISFSELTSRVQPELLSRVQPESMKKDSPFTKAELSE
ncbi:hypothetical protein Tco_0675664 [Tanacetum coccineum]